MPRAAASSDVFAAVAEPVRRRIIGLLAGRAKAVGDVVAALGRAQPAVSKHLRVLREAGLVRVRRHGRHRVYELDAAALRPVHEWVKGFERFWEDHLDRVKVRAEARAKDGGAGGGGAGTADAGSAVDRG